ncbi:MAG: hypothetical protein KI790_12260 [Cyclobacteriaceae bacterium]|nr:hypothetical protein [Cyclobacteriaceae bacterium HetDA_MAG_MS6]
MKDAGISKFSLSDLQRVSSPGKSSETLPPQVDKLVMILQFASAGLNDGGDGPK